MNNAKVYKNAVNVLKKSAKKRSQKEASIDRFLNEKLVIVGVSEESAKILKKTVKRELMK